MHEVIFNTQINEKLDAASIHLPLCKDDADRLLSQLPMGEFTFLTLRSPYEQEHVLVMNQAGSLVMERGVNDTAAQTFPRGSCVLWETSTAVVKWLVCNHDCCSASPCVIEPVSIAGFYSPPAEVNKFWEGNVIFSGSTPMQIGASTLPSWLTAKVGSNYLQLQGTPPVPGDVQVAVAAVNDAGKVVTQPLTVKVT